MKRIIYLLILFPIFIYSQTKVLPFKNGESCSYHIHYGILGGGNADYIISQNKEVTKVIVEGESNYFVDLFFMIRDRYETVINNSTVSPKYFKRDIIEGEDEIHQEYFFNNKSNIVKTHKGDFEMVQNSQDMLSAFMYGRTFSSKYLKQKEPFYINLFIDEENYKMEVRYLGTEIINSKIGKIKCIKLAPKVQVGRVFSNEDDLIIWVSDDKNHILIKIEMGILVGSIEVDIISAKNIKFPLSITD